MILARIYIPDWPAIAFVAILVALAVIVATGIHKRSRIARYMVVVMCLLLLGAVVQSLFFSVVH